MISLKESAWASTSDSHGIFVSEQFRRIFLPYKSSCWGVCSVPGMLGMFHCFQHCSIMEFEEIVFSPSLVELSLIGKTKVLSGGSWTRVTLFSSWLLNCCLNFSHQQNRTKVTLFGLHIHCVSSFSLLVLLFLGCVASYSCLWSLLSVVWLFLSIVGQENEKNCLLPWNASCLQHEMINNMEKEIEQESPEAVTAENESTEKKSCKREKRLFAKNDQNEESMKRAKNSRRD